MIIQARMENIFNFLSSCDTFHMSALFLLKPLTFLFGLSVLFVFPQKKKKKKKYKLYPGGKQRQGWGSISQLICSHLPSPCIPVLQNLAAFLIVPHPSPTSWITVGFSLRCSWGLEPEVEAKLKSRSGTGIRAQMWQNPDLWRCSAAPASHIHGIAWHGIPLCSHQPLLGPLHSSPTMRLTQDPTKIMVKTH